MEEEPTIIKWMSGLVLVAMCLLGIGQGVALGVAAYREAWPEQWMFSEIVTFGMWSGLALLCIAFGLAVPYMFVRQRRTQDEIADVLEGDEEGGEGEDEEHVVEYGEGS